MLKICQRKSIFWLAASSFMVDHSSYRGASVHSKLGLIIVVLLVQVQFYMSISADCSFFLISGTPTRYVSENDNYD